MHYPDALRAVQAGRSIIMEKPFTLTAKECADVIRLAQDRNVWLFEAITTLHSPCFQFMKECLPRLGPLRGGTMSFFHDASPLCSVPAAHCPEHHV